MFARLWNLTLAEFDRLTYLSDEYRLLLSCHVVVVVVSALSVLSLLLVRLLARPPI